MCRLYAIIASEPTKVECGLVRAQNALLSQSRSDARGTSHADGWGLAHYAESHPVLDRRASSASQDLRFVETAKSVCATVVLAHVRKASVGPASEQNTHPFRHGPWTFAHNGTITAFERVRPFLEEETARELLRSRRGETDSELAFLWILTRLRREEARSMGLGTTDLAACMQRSIRRLIECCALQTSDPPGLNFLMSDGRRLFASRWNRSLHWVTRRERGRCEVCTDCHCHRCVDAPLTQHASPYRSIVVASEPVTAEQWDPVPEGHLLSVDRRLDARVFPI